MYSDIIDLPHHVSLRHRPMPMSGRAAQFAPFAALSGHGAAIVETARLTDSRVEMSDDGCKELDMQMEALRMRIDSRPVAHIRHFVPDERKQGGAYHTMTAPVVRIDDYARELVLADGTHIAVDSIVSLSLGD